MSGRTNAAPRRSGMLTKCWAVLPGTGEGLKSNTEFCVDQSENLYMVYHDGYDASQKKHRQRMDKVGPDGQKIWTVELGLVVCQNMAAHLSCKDGYLYLIQYNSTATTGTDTLLVLSAKTGEVRHRYLITKKGTTHSFMLPVNPQLVFYEADSAVYRLQVSDEGEAANAGLYGGSGWLSAGNDYGSKPLLWKDTLWYSDSQGTLYARPTSPEGYSYALVYGTFKPYPGASINTVVLDEKNDRMMVRCGSYTAQIRASTGAVTRYRSKLPSDYICGKLFSGDDGCIYRIVPHRADRTRWTVSKENADGCLSWRAGLVSEGFKSPGSTQPVRISSNGSIYLVEGYAIAKYRKE